MNSLYSVAEACKKVSAEGVYVWNNFLGTSERDGLYLSLQNLLQTQHAIRYDASLRVWNLANHGPEYVSLLADERLQKIASGILGAGCLVSDYSANVVFPSGQPSDLHMDYPFNMMQVETAKGALGIQCVLNLDDFTKENGATEYVPGSHRQFRLPKAKERIHIKQFLAPKGSLLVMASSTWHRAGNNLSNLNRHAILFCFVEKWVRPMHSFYEYY